VKRCCSSLSDPLVVQFGAARFSSRQVVQMFAVSDNEAALELLAILNAANDWILSPLKERRAARSRTPERPMGDH